MPHRQLSISESGSLRLRAAEQVIRPDARITWPKRAWRLAGTFLILALLIGACLPRCPDEVYVYFESPILAGEREAVRKLSDALRRCPKAQRYDVFWKEVIAGEELGRRALVYERRNKLIGYEYDPGSGFSGAVYVVDDAAIHAVAQKYGRLDDFTAHGPRAW
jgi:hypothetical protein